MNLYATFSVLLLALTALANPEWLEDPGNSRWITFGGESGIAETAGITLRPAGKEGMLTPVTRGGIGCAQSVMAGDRLGYFYLVCEPWQELSTWLGDHDVLLTVRYFDGGKGRFHVQYDSSDHRVHHSPYPPGVWKVPPALHGNADLVGDESWKTLHVRLPFAYFRKRLHGADIRLNSVNGDFALAGVAITKVPREADVPTNEVLRTIANQAWRVAIDEVGIASLESALGDQPIAKAPAVHASLLSLVMKPPGLARPQPLDLYNATLQNITGSDSEVVLVHDFPNGLRSRITARFAENGQATFQVRLENASELEVAELRFPVLTGIALNGDSADDWIAVSKCWGQIWQTPSARRLNTYWGTSMRWIGLWDEAQGLYLGIEDERLDDYGFTYGGDAAGTTLAPVQRILVKPGETWESAVYRLATVEGGSWHPAADVYRDYVSRALETPVPPPHLTWLVDRWSTQDSNIAPYYGWDMIRPDGQALMAANRQMLDGADSGYCGLFPYPSPVWGSIEEFQQKLQVLHAHGQLYTPYHNFHLWSPGYGHYPRIGTFPKSRLPSDVPTPDDTWYEHAAAKGYDGSYRRLETDRFAQVGMAMPSREWRDWLKYWTQAYTDWGADGMYYDQFNMVYGTQQLYPDYPDTYGAWVRSTLDTIRQLKTDALRQNPFYTASGEVCNDIYGQILDLHMTSGVFNRLDLYRYCNPRHLLIDGGWNGGTREPFGGKDRWRFIWQTGARFEGDPGDDILHLRRAVKSHLYASSYMDTVGLQLHRGGKLLAPAYLESSYQHGPVSGYSGRWFLIDHDDQRGALVNVINVPVLNDATATIDTSRFGPVKAAWAWTVDGRFQRVGGTQEGDSYTFTIPASELSSVVLVNRLAPMVRWDFPRAVSTDVREAISLTLTNLMPEPIFGRAAIRETNGIDHDGEAAFGPLASGDSLTFALPFEVTDRPARGLQDMWAEVTTSSGVFHAYAMFGVSDDLLADLRGVPGTYHVYLRNLTDKAIDGTLRVGIPEPLQASVPEHFDLPPRAELRVPITVTGQAALREITELRASVDLGWRHKRELVRAVMPVIPNGDFETDSAGDQRADWWMSRKRRDAWAYERIRLTTDAHSGQYALQIDPPAAGASFICAYPVHSVLAPNSRYRISVWIRSKAKDGVFLRHRGLTLGKGKTTADWQEFSGEITTGDRPGSFYRLLYNYSEHPAYFDDIRVEKLP